MIKSTILAVLVLIGSITPVIAAETLAFEAPVITKGGLPQPTEQQKLLQCTYEGQLARGLTANMWMAGQVAKNFNPQFEGVVPQSFMKAYIDGFYNKKDTSELIALASAIWVLDWIYTIKPPLEASQQVGKAFTEDCLNEYPMYYKALKLLTI